jgi:hypothetical protein
VTGIAPVIDAVHVILRRLDDLPAGPEVADLRERALACIEEVVAWNAARTSTERRHATMVRVLVLHVAANKLASSLGFETAGQTRLGAEHRATARTARLPPP